MADKITSPLLGPLNNIVKINRTKSQMRTTQTSLQNYLRFMEIETKKVKSIQLPSKRKIKDLQTLNIASSFGNAGSLLSSLFSGALDVGGFLGEFFGRGKGGGKPIPKTKGFKIGGIKALGIANAAFAGLDFATGLAEGESVGKSAAGSGGALAGSLLGGAIGQALIPVPGLGFMVGSMAGNFLGGYLGDRTYEAVTGEGNQKKEELDRRLKAQAEEQRSQSQTGISFIDVVNQFGQTINNFERFVYESFAGMANASASATGQEQNYELGADYPDQQQGAGEKTGELSDIIATGGKSPSQVIKTSGFGPRWGREHRGNDYAGRGVDHEPISVIQPGKVVYAGALGTAGNAVVIDHPDGSTTKYFHLANGSISVSQGQQIKPGQVIGVVGNTGRSTGTHLHFEIWRGGKAIDPSGDADNYFRFGGSVQVKVQKKEDKTPPPSPKPMTEDEFHAARTDRDVSDKADIRVGDTENYKDYLKYFEENKNKIAAAEAKQTTADEITPETKSSFQSRRESRGSGYVPPSASVRADESQSRTQPQATQKIQQYPSYNAPRETITIMPIITPPGAQQRPMIISAGGGKQVSIPAGNSSKGEVLNNVVKSMLLTNLSGS